MSLDAELGRLVRRHVASLERDAGAVVPETDGNQALPVTATRQGQVGRSLFHGRTDSYADRDDTGPAHRNAPNSFGFRKQDRPSMGGYREETVFAPADEDGAIVTIDPAQAAMWWVDCAGSVTIQIADPEPIDGLDEYVEEPTQSELVTIFLVRFRGATVSWPADWQWSVEVRGGAIGSDNPFAGASEDAQIDVFTIMRVPNRGVFAFISGRKFS